MKFVIAFVGILLLVENSSAQVAPDFTITDINGVEHNLYERLNSEHTVIINFFFLGCTPCEYYLPDLKQLNIEYGAAAGGGLEIWIISKQDESAELAAFNLENDYPFYFFGVDGGGYDVVQAFEIIYDTLFYPNYTVVCPDASTTFDIWPVTDGIWEIESVMLQCNYDVAIESVSNSDFKIYPNPASTMIQFEGENFDKIRISELNGRILFETESSINQIAIENLEPGMYLFSGFKNNQQIITSLFMKK